MSFGRSIRPVIRPRAIAIAWIIAVIMAIGILPARAVDLFTVKGTVRDPAGSALAGVRVSYTSRSTYTDAQGKYTLGFSNAGTYAITAARSDLNSQTKNVNVVTQIGPVDFTLTYVLVGALTPGAFNTTPKTITLTAASTAPSTSCVTATVQPSGSDVPLTYSSTGPDGTNTWNATWEVPAGTQDGAYGVTYKAVTCSASILLTNTATQTYFVDSVAPIADPRTLIPLDHGNAIFTAQRLMAKLTDPNGSGVDPATISFTLSSGSSSASYSASYDPSTSWAKTSTLSFTTGNSYTARVDFSDYAGNSQSLSWSFLALLTPSIGTGTGSLYAEGVNTGQNGSTVGTKKWSFSPRVSMSGRTVHFTAGSNHAGWGTVAASLPIDAAKIRVTIAGVTQEWTKKPYAAGTTKTIYQNVTYLPTSGAPADVNLEPTSATLPTVSLDLPVGTEAATLVLESAQSTATFAGVCADPSTTSISCTPDPLRFFLPERFSDRLANFNSQAEMSSAGCVPGTDCLPAISILQMVPDPTGPTTKGGIWKILPPLVDFCSVNVPSPGTLCLISGVLYPTSAVIYPPETFASTCSEAQYCTYETAAANDERRSRCVTNEGADRPYTQSGPEDDPPWVAEYNPCNQVFTLFSWVNTKIGNYTKKRIHIFEGSWSSEWGVQDGDYDELGLHWATNDKFKRWTRADPRDIPEYGDFGATSGPPFQAYHSGDSYPFGHEDEYYDCFYFAGKYKIPANERTFSDSTGHAWGAGTGTDTGSIRGWPQWRQYSCSSGFVYVRTTSGLLRAVMEEYRYPGNEIARNNGNVMTTWGHREESGPNYWDLLDIACTLATGGYGQAACSAYGIVLKLTNTDRSSSYESQISRDPDGPGPTPDWGFPYYEEKRD